MAAAVHKVDISWDRRPAGVVAHVVFDNARRLNVLNPPALLDLTEAFLGAGPRGRPARRGVLRRRRQGLHRRRRHQPHGDDEDIPRTAARFLTLIHKLCQAIRDCPVPVICRPKATRWAPGLEVAAACDMRIAADNAFFGMPEVKVGVPSVVEAALLPRLIGWGRTSWHAADRREHRRRQGRGAGAWSRRSCRWPKLDEAVERCVQARSSRRRPSRCARRSD